MSANFVTAIVSHETSHSFLLEVNGLQHWIAKNLIDATQIINQKLSIPAFIADKWSDNDYKDLEVLIKKLTTNSKLLIESKPNQYHQQLAFDKLYQLSVFALFMQVRAGKTKVAIDILCNHAKNGLIDRVLWFCPLSVVETARREWQKHAVLELPVTIVGLETVSGCSDERFNRDTECMSTSCAVIIDESHMIKNGMAVRSKRLSNLLEIAPVKGLLSGTAITRNVDDLYNQIFSLDWRIFGYHSWYQFQRHHLIMSDKIAGMIYDVKNIEYLADRLKPFTFEWSDDYSDRVKFKSVNVEMSELQYSLYQQAKDVIIERLESFTEKKSDIYVLFSSLCSIMSGHVSKKLMQQLFGEFAGEKTLPAPKVQALVNQVNELDGKVLVWCTRRHDIALLRQAIPDAIELSGTIKPEERDRRIQQFKEADNAVMVAMVQVARRGINLSECNNVIYYSHSFDYEAREQSKARTLLPTKTDVCVYVDMIYSNGLDRRLLASHDKKQGIIKEFVDLLSVDREAFVKELKRL